MEFQSVSLLLAGSLACITAWNVASGQQVVPLPVQDLLQISTPRPPIAFSPDGKWLAYAVQTRVSAKPTDDDRYLRTGVPWWGVGSDICIINVNSGETINLTGSRDDNWLPSWSPDGRYLAFLSDRGRDGQAHLWLWDATNNDLRGASELRVRMQGLERIDWTRDGLRVLLANVPVDMSLGEYSQETTLGPQNSQGDNANKIPGSTVTLYGAGTAAPVEAAQARTERLSLNLNLRDLSLVEVSTGRVQTIIQHQRIGAFHLLPNSISVAYTKPEWFEETGSQRVVYDLLISTPSEFKERVIATGIGLDLAGQFSVSLDGSQLSYRASGANGEFEICVVAKDGGKPRNLTHSQQEWHQRYSLIPLWDAKGENVYFITAGILWRGSVRDGCAKEVARVAGRQIEQLLHRSDNVLWTDDDVRFTVVLARDDASKQEGFYKIDLTSGSSTRLLEDTKCYSCGGAGEGLFAASRDGRSFAFFAEDAQHPVDIWKADSLFAKPVRLTYFNPQLDRVKMGNARTIDWLSDDGDLLRGALLLPSTYQEGNRYPLIVLVYPSARLSDSVSRFGGTSFINAQLFATRGYAVLLPDSPQHVGTPMTDVAKTVLPAVNKVIEMGIADPDRLGLMGHSNGGYGTVSLIVSTKRFKAAIEASGPANLIGFYGEMKKDGTAYGNTLERSVDPLGGTPWEYRDRYVENSPIFYLDRVETPLLIVHGAEDTTVDSFLGDELFVCLRRLGKVVEYAKYGGEGHDLTSRTNELDFADRAIAWFERYVKGKSAQ